VLAMPKKPVENNSGAENARQYVKSLRDSVGGMKPFYTVLYGREPQGKEHITLNNQVIRGNYSAEFVALIVERFNLSGVTLGEFYLGD